MATLTIRFASLVDAATIASDLVHLMATFQFDEPDFNNSLSYSITITEGDEFFKYYPERIAYNSRLRLRGIFTITINS